MRLLCLWSDHEGSAEAVRKPQARERRKPNFDDKDDGKPFQASHKAEVGKSAYYWVGLSVFCIFRKYFQQQQIVAGHLCFGFLCMYQLVIKKGKPSMS